MWERGVSSGCPETGVGRRGRRGHRGDGVRARGGAPASLKNLATGCALQADLGSEGRDDQTVLANHRRAERTGRGIELGRSG